jgi:glycerol-3-phosphate dehydrogenase subunit B
MRTDALVLGAELEGLVAALRLAEQGLSVRLIATGGGSLHYAPGGLHLLGYGPGNGAAPIAEPFAAIEALEARHPLRLLGAPRIRPALDWFLGQADGLGLAFRSNGGNALAVTAAGRALPVFAQARHQATFADLEGERVAVVCFEGHRDFPAGMTVAELRRRGLDAHLLRVEPPCEGSGSLRLARGLDALPAPEAAFEPLRARLPDGCTRALFPAILGLDRHAEVLAAAEGTLGVPCLEVPTLPPSIPGLRLDRALTRHLERRGVLLHLGASPVRAAAAGGACEAVWDEAGRSYEAGVFVVATGGVLMGGLEVDSHGRVHEPLFGLDVVQTRPLDAEGSDRALDALHETGVEADDRLRPLAGGEPAFDNIFVTGRTLAHWNPARESSAEGVAIATGWAAAEEARTHLGG